MTISLKHAFQSVKSAGVDSTLVQPANWNAEHVLQLAAGHVLGRDASTDGVAQELPLSFSADGTGATFGLTGYVCLASGTSAQRPANAAGYERWNTDLTKKEYNDGTAWQNYASETYVLNQAPVLRNHIDGLEVNAAGSSTIFSIDAGAATDTTNAALMILAAAYTKTSAAWAVGSGNGSLDTGAVAINTTYHVHLIKRIDTSVVDILTSLSATAPTLPANYTLGRRIRSMRTDGTGQWLPSFQSGDKIDIVSTGADFTAGGTAAMTLQTLGAVPTGVVLQVFGTAALGTTGGGRSTLSFAPAGLATALMNVSVSDNSIGFAANIPVPPVTTNLLAQINIAVPDFSSAAVFIVTGYYDRRGK